MYLVRNSMMCGFQSGSFVLISFRMSSAPPYFVLAFVQSLSRMAASPSWMRKYASRNRSPGSAAEAWAAPPKHSATKMHNRRVFFIGRDCTEKPLDLQWLDVSASCIRNVAVAHYQL